MMQGKTRRVAVIAIHGVGKHEPGATAGALVRLLQSAVPGYEDFAQTNLSLPVDTAGLFPAPMPNDVPKWRQLFLGSRFARLSADFTPYAGRTDLNFTETLLSDGQGHRAFYQTCRWRGRRTGARPAEVDVYEMYWSDLSHVGAQALVILEQLIQLVMHVASLGRTTAAAVLGALDAGGNARPARWTWFYRFNAASYWLLSMPILVGNLILLLMAALFVPAMLSSDWLHPAIAVVIGVTVAAGLSWGVYRIAGERAKPLCLVAAPLLAAACAGLIYRMPAQPMSQTDLAFCLSLWEAPALLLAGEAVMRRYAVGRPGAEWWWRIMAGCMVLSMIAVYFCLGNQRGGAIYRTLVPWLGHSVEVFFTAMAGVWALLCVTNMLLLLCGVWVMHRPGPLAASRTTNEIRRSVWTCFVAAALPAPLFLACVLLLWSLINAEFSTLIAPAQIFMPWNPMLFGIPHGDGMPVYHVIAKLIDQSAGRLFVLYAALILAAALLIIGAFAPSIVAEVLPPEDATNTPSWALGRWLDRGYRWIGAGAGLAIFGFFIVFPVSGGVSYLPLSSCRAQPWFDALCVTSFAKITGIALGGTAVVFAAATRAFVSRSSSFLARIRVLLDTLLDVDNWLREHPKGATPRLKIFARYTSLLRYLTQRKPAERYDSLVVVAHSQGTVITADVFRYLTLALGNAYLSRFSSVRLLTAGSPLHQLYAWRFPELYRWVHRPPYLGGGRRGPDPGDAGLSRWVNMYGSGDYVGRYLWTADNDPARWDTDVLRPGPWPATAEACVGAAAHTHYFDPDNVTVGTQIDALI